MNRKTAESYRSTIWACYLSSFIGAIVINLTPILFIPLREIYGLSYTQFGVLLAVNFVTQIVADVVFSYPVDRYGYRPFLILAPLLTMAGYGVFALSPEFLADPYPGFLLGTVLFAATGGLLELLLSPIINGIPGDEKATMMSVLHSFYAWGQMTVVLLTTLMIFYLGRGAWQWIIAAWATLPFINFVQFIVCKLPEQVPATERQGARILLRDRFFYLIVLTIALGGMAEVTMALWASAFMERGMGMDKLTGDIAGMCMFAAMLGSGRLLYGLFGQKTDVWKVMMLGAGAAFVLYMTVAFSPYNILSLAACALCGLAVSLLWPGAVSLAGAQFPLAGAWLFAMLAAGGDMGASLGPYSVGLLADHAGNWGFFRTMFGFLGVNKEQIGLRSGLVLGAIFPLLTFIMLFWLRKYRKGGAPE